MLEVGRYYLGSPATDSYAPERTRELGATVQASHRLLGQRLDHHSPNVCGPTKKATADRSLPDGGNQRISGGPGRGQFVTFDRTLPKSCSLCSLPDRREAKYLLRCRSFIQPGHQVGGRCWRPYIAGHESLVFVVVVIVEPQLHRHSFIVIGSCSSSNR